MKIPTFIFLLSLCFASSNTLAQANYLPRGWANHYFCLGITNGDSVVDIEILYPYSNTYNPTSPTIYIDETPYALEQDDEDCNQNHLLCYKSKKEGAIKVNITYQGYNVLKTDNIDGFKKPKVVIEFEFDPKVLNQEKITAECNFYKGTPAD
jgi:hypothetical protein